MNDFLTKADGVCAATGTWTLENVAAIADEIASGRETCDTVNAAIDRLDTAGAALLHGLSSKINGLQPEQQALLNLIVDNDPDDKEHTPQPNAIARFLIHVGRTTVTLWNDILALVTFTGETTVTLLRVLLNPKRLRLSSIARHIRETGLAAVPIVALIAFLISVVLAYQGANQLRRFGAEIFTINMVAVSVLREMGVLLTAIMIAGRSGSAFTAEIGVMKVNEEVDAMRIIGVNPFEILVLPRLLALIITLPLLAFIADLMGLAGGGLISYSLMQIGYDQYLDRFRDAVSMSDFWVGMVKAPVFAFFIAIVGCMRGMQVSGSAESIGRLTTISVVQSIFLVLLLDALFSILFTKLGI